MKNKQFIQASCLAMLFALLLSSCSSTKLVTSSVAYQSIRTTFRQDSPVPEDAKIMVTYAISETGIITPYVQNKSDEIMIIDQTMSFFVNTTGQSVSYYDPTVKTQTVSEFNSNTKGASVNLGAIAGAVGVGGIVGKALSGVNVGGSGTSGQTTSNTTYVVDQPRISLAPRSECAMSKNFQIIGIGASYLGSSNVQQVNTDAKSSPKRFSVCISYSLDGGENFQKIVTNFFVNSEICVPVQKHGIVNESLRKIYTQKPDALNEPCWLLYFANNIGGANKLRVGLLYDYQ